MEDVRKKLKHCGKGVKIYSLAKIINPEVIEVGDHSQIDDFTLINGGKGLKIGRYVHITYFTSIAGNGSLFIGDYAGISAGVRILTSTNVLDEAWSMSAKAPEDIQRSEGGHIDIDRFAFVGANSVVFPNVRIGEGAVVGALSLVNKDVEPWSVSFGTPCRKYRDRPKPSYPPPE